MARRAKDQSGSAVLLIILVIAAAVIAPVAILGWWLVCEIKVRAWRSMSWAEILPNEDERVQLATHQRALDRAERVISDIRSEGLRSGASYRQDGYFDARSRAGGYANAKLEGAEQTQAAAYAVIQAFREGLAQRADGWVTHVAQWKAARLGAGAYLLGLVGLWFVWSEWVLASAVSGVVSAGLIFLRERMLRRRLFAQLAAH